jgi:hypothetical protein
MSSAVYLVKRFHLIKLCDFLSILLALLSIVGLFLSIFNAQLIAGCFSICVLSMAFIMKIFVQSLDPDTLKFTLD